MKSIKSENGFRMREEALASKYTIRSLGTILKMKGHKNKKFMFNKLLECPFKPYSIQTASALASQGGPP